MIFQRIDIVVGYIVTETGDAFSSIKVFFLYELRTARYKPFKIK